MLVEVEPKGIVLDDQKRYLVLLQDKKKEKLILPIHIGFPEAQAITLAMEKMSIGRPLSHELMNSICQHLDASVNRVVINDIRNNTFYAQVYLKKDSEEIVLDSRPSDAIALALRCDAPIYMAQKLVEFTVDYDDILYKEDENSDNPPPQ